MKEVLYRVKFVYTGNPNKFIRTIMEKEYLRCYNEYVGITNNGLTERLNKEFFDAHPEKDDVWGDSEYHRFMAENYFKYAASTIKSKLLRFRVDPDEVNLIGILKMNPRITMDMFLIPEETF